MALAGIQLCVTYQARPTRANAELGLSLQAVHAEDKLGSGPPSQAASACMNMTAIEQHRHCTVCCPTAEWAKQNQIGQSWVRQDSLGQARMLGRDPMVTWSR